MVTKEKQLLSELKKGAKGIIVDFKDETIASRLITMGILPKSSFELIGKAPLRGGYYIKCDKQRIALRKVEAESILVAVE